MARQNVAFQSGDHTIRGWLYTPDDRPGPHPTVVMAGGWCYVKEIVQPAYAELYAANGMAALLFDYRNFGESDGPRRQHIDPNQQIEDYRNAITYAETLDVVDADRIGVWGLSYSGGHALIVGAIDPRVKTIESQIPVIAGYENMKFSNGAVNFRRLEHALVEARRLRARTGEETYVPHFTEDVENVISAWPYPEGYQIFKHFQDTTAPNYDFNSTIESVELLMNYDVRPFLPRIVNTPTLVVVAEKDDITPWEDAIAAYHAIPSATKRLQVIERSDHLALYSNRSLLEQAAEIAKDWFVEHL